METIFVISVFTYVIIFVVFYLYMKYEPMVDYIEVKGRKRKILWYNTKNGRTWRYLC